MSGLDASADRKALSAGNGRARYRPASFGRYRGRAPTQGDTVAPTRNSIISKGMVYSPNHGDTAFTVPLFDGFMKRVMPEL
jgi:hypothetical protein